MSHWSCGLCVVALSGGMAVAGAAGCPQPLRIGFTDRASPPALMGQGSQFADPPGWGVVAVRDALRQLACKAELVRLPGRRLSAALAHGEVQFALFYGPSPERLRSYAFPLDAQGHPDAAWAPVIGHLALFGRAGTAPDWGWDGVHLLPHARIGVLAGSVQEALATERGWTIETVLTFDSEVAMLHAQRFDLLLTAREGLTPEQRADLTELTPPVALQPYFMPATPVFARQHKAWTRAFWTELCQAVRRQAPEARPVDCGVVPPPPARHEAKSPG
jgi:hypothetical protein